MEKSNQLVVDPKEFGIEETKAEAELSKGDAEKFQSLINDMEALKTKYSFKSAKYKKLQATVNELLDKIVNHVK